MCDSNEYFDEIYDFDIPMRHSTLNLFRQINNLRLSKIFPMKNIIYRILIQATYTFVKEDFDEVKNYLVSVKRVRIHLLEHYYHNREWCRKRVRMLTPKRL